MGTWLSSLAVYGDARLLAVLVLGFASGLPLALTASTLSVWLAEEGVSLTAIGLFALVGLPYTLKFLWAPLVDRLTLPWFTRHLGRRRGWTLFTQLLLLGAILLMGQLDPSADPQRVALLALVVAFCSATQDIVIDALRVEMLEERQYGAGAAMVVLGYRLGMLASGAGALFTAEVAGWAAAYALMALLMGAGMLVVVLIPEPLAPVAPGGGWLRGAVVAPLQDFARRPGWVWILLLVLLYKLGDALAGVMGNPFFLALGFGKTDIAAVAKVFGLGATLLGGVVGGVLVHRLGIAQSLLWCGALQMGSNLMYVALAWTGASMPMLMATVAVENLAGGMGTAAFVAYLSSLCSVAFTATQYALLSSLAAAGRTVLASSGGWLVEQLDWTLFFLATTVAALPGLALLVWVQRRFAVTTAPPGPH